MYSEYCVRQNAVPMQTGVRFFGTRHGWIDGSLDAKCRMQQGRKTLLHSTCLASESVLISQSFARLQLCFCAVEIDENVAFGEMTCFCDMTRTIFYFICSRTRLSIALALGCLPWEQLYFIGRICWFVPVATDTCSSVFTRSNIVWNRWKSTLKVRSMRGRLNQGTAMQKYCLLLFIWGNIRISRVRLR